jgi:hypothetical protein
MDTQLKPTCLRAGHSYWLNTVLYGDVLQGPALVASDAKRLLEALLQMFVAAAAGAVQCCSGGTLSRPMPGCWLIPQLSTTGQHGVA